MLFIFKLVGTKSHAQKCVSGSTLWIKINVLFFCWCTIKTKFGFSKKNPVLFISCLATVELSPKKNEDLFIYIFIYLISLPGISVWNTLFHTNTLLSNGLCVMVSDAFYPIKLVNYCLNDFVFELVALRKLITVLVVNWLSTAVDPSSDLPLVTNI